MEPAWGVAAATGVGSLPGDDIDEAARMVMGELPQLPHLPELPGRGVGADMIGRTAALLVDLHVDLQTSGWRLVARAGRDERRASAMLRADLDAIEIAAYGYRGPFKIQVAGPLTLAAILEQTRGDRVVADYGARRDLAQSLAEGVREHVADVAARLPEATLVVQVDEPAMPAVLAGAIPTVSGFGRLRSVDETTAQQLLGTVVAAAAEAAVPVVHCCAAEVPVAMIRRAGAAALGCDVAQLAGAGLDELADALDAGLALWPGVVPSLRPGGPVSGSDLAGRLTRLADRLDADADRVAEWVVTPTCGLAGADHAWVREAYGLVTETARVFHELVGEDR